MNSKTTETLKASNSKLISFKTVQETENTQKKEVILFEIKSTNENTTVDSILELTKTDRGYMPRLIVEDLPQMETSEDTIAKYAEWLIRLGKAIQKENELKNFTNIKI